MAEARDLVLGGCLAAGMLGGAFSCCGLAVLVGLVRLVEGEGAVHDVAAVIDDDCELAGVWDDGPEGHLEAIAGEALLAEIYEDDPTSKEMDWLFEPVVWALLHTDLAACDRPEGPVVAVNPKRLGGLWSLGTEMNDDHAAVRIGGLPFRESGEGAIYGMVDSTLLVAPSRDLAEEAVDALTGTPEPSWVRDALTGEGAQAGVGMAGMQDGRKVQFQLWALGPDSYRMEMEIQPDGARERLQETCGDLEALPRVTVECTVLPAGDGYRMEAEISGREGILEGVRGFGADEPAPRGGAGG